jgi:phosphohistidine phosphatase
MVLNIMKTLILVRHAKSSWEDFAVPDFERPLNERGKHDAPMMAKRLLDKGIEIDALVSSPAKRSKRTAQAFAEVLGKDQDKIIFREELYMAGVDAFYNVICQLDESINKVAIFSHNPGITVFANMLQVAEIDEMPTCSIFAITSTAENWSGFRNAKKKFWFFDYPKNTA